MGNERNKKKRVSFLKQIFPRWCWKLAMRRDGEFCSTPRSPSNPVATNDCFFGTQVDILVPWCFFTNLLRKMTESPRRKMIPNDDWWFRNVHWWFVVDDVFFFVMMQMMDVDDDVSDVDDVDDRWKRGLPLTRWIFRVGVYVFPGAFLAKDSPLGVRLRGGSGS